MDDNQIDDLLCDILDLCCVDTDHSKGVQLIGPNFDKAKALISQRELEARELGFTTKVQSIFAECMVEDFGTYDQKMFANRILEEAETALQAQTKISKDKET